MIGCVGSECMWILYTVSLNQRAFYSILRLVYSRGGGMGVDKCYQYLGNLLPNLNVGRKLVARDVNDQLKSSPAKARISS